MNALDGRIVNLKKSSQSALYDRLEQLQRRLGSHPQGQDIQSLVADLQVHQIELELQNRELQDAQRRVEQSHDEYAQLYDFAPVGYMTLAPSGKILRINLTGARMLSRERLRIAGTPLSVFLQREDVPSFFKHLKNVFGKGGKCCAQVRITPRGQAPVDVRLESVAVTSRDGVIACQSAMIDITERIRAEAAIQTSEDRYRTLFMHSPDAIVVAEQGYVTLVNDAALRLFGARTSHALLGRPLQGLFLARYRRFDFPYTQHTHSPDQRPRESKIVRLDGAPVDVEMLTAPFSNRGTDAVHVILRDITERKALEQEVIEVSTAEQERIGREVHDGIGQELTGLSMLASGLEHRLRQQERWPEAQVANQLVHQLQHVLHEARALAHGLSLVQITPDDLPDAISVLVERAQASVGTPCRFRLFGDVGSLTEAAATQLYRIAQEAVHNATKHAQASRIVVRLVGTDHSVTLSVRDDGLGFNPLAPDNKGLGVHAMRYRAKVIDADLKITSSAEAGTTVECRWSGPLSNEDAKRRECPALGDEHINPVRGPTG